MSNKLLEIEQAINALSLDEQKLLVQRLNKQIKEKTNNIIAKNKIESQLEIMANDPDIQAEIALINQEFMITEIV